MQPFVDDGGELTKNGKRLWKGDGGWYHVDDEKFRDFGAAYKKFENVTRGNLNSVQVKRLVEMIHSTVNAGDYETASTMESDLVKLYLEALISGNVDNYQEIAKMILEVNALEFRRG